MMVPGARVELEGISPNDFEFLSNLPCYRNSISVYGLEPPNFPMVA